MPHVVQAMRSAPASSDRRIPVVAASTHIAASRSSTATASHWFRKERRADLDAQLGRDPRYENRKLGEPVTAFLARWPCTGWCEMPAECRIAECWRL